MAKILFVADAFSNGYLTPNVKKTLHDNRYLSLEVKQPNGFCERLPLLSRSHQNIPLSAIGFLGFPKNNLFRGLSNGLRFFDFIFLRKVLNKTVLRNTMRLYNIPLHFWVNFFLQEEDSIQNRSCSREVQRLNAINLDYFTNMLRPKYKTDSQRLSGLRNFLLDECNTDSDETVLLYYGNLDAVGHKYGPLSAEVDGAVLNCLDTFFELVNSFPKHDFVLLGDHGMAQIEECFDFRAQIVKLVSDELMLQENRDFTYFIDSTFARIWAKDSSTLSIIFDKLFDSIAVSQAGTLSVVDSDQMNGNRDAFILFAVDKNRLIWPDFFGNKGAKHPLGMHGHLVEDPFLTGVVMFSKNSNFVTRKKSSSICISEVLNLLEAAEQ